MTAGAMAGASTVKFGRGVREREHGVSLRRPFLLIHHGAFIGAVRDVQRAWYIGNEAWQRRCSLSVQVGRKRTVWTPLQARRSLDGVSEVLRGFLSDLVGSVHTPVPCLPP